MELTPRVPVGRRRPLRAPALARGVDGKLRAAWGGACARGGITLAGPRPCSPRAAARRLRPARPRPRHVWRRDGRHGPVSRASRAPARDRMVAGVARPPRRVDLPGILVGPPRAGPRWMEPGGGCAGRSESGNSANRTFSSASPRTDGACCWRWPGPWSGTGRHASRQAGGKRCCTPPSCNGVRASTAERGTSFPIVPTPATASSWTPAAAPGMPSRPFQAAYVSIGSAHCRPPTCPWPPICYASSAPPRSARPA